MFKFKLQLPNPLNINRERKTYFSKSGKISGHLGWEAGAARESSPSDILDLDIDLTLKYRDHPGFSFYLNIFGYNIEFSVYDDRHWDYNTGKLKE